MSQDLFTDWLGLWGFRLPKAVICHLSALEAGEAITELAGGSVGNQCQPDGSAVHLHRYTSARWRWYPSVCPSVWSEGELLCSLTVRSTPSVWQNNTESNKHWVAKLACWRRSEQTAWGRRTVSCRFVVLQFVRTLSYSVKPPTSLCYWVTEETPETQNSFHKTDGSDQKDLNLCITLKGFLSC